MPTSKYIGWGKYTRARNLKDTLHERGAQILDHTKTKNFCPCARIYPALESLAELGLLANERLVSKETVLPRRWGSETLKFGAKEVDKSPTSIVKR